MSGSCLDGGQDKNFTMSTFTLLFFAAPNTSTATSCAKSLPSFAAPNMSSATSCAKSFACVFHVSPQGARVFDVGSELADGDRQDEFPTRPPASTRVLGVSPKGCVGAACVCWACLKIGRESAFLKRATAVLGGEVRQRSWDIGKDSPSVRAMPGPFFEATRPGAGVLLSYCLSSPVQTPGRHPRTPALNRGPCSSLPGV